jgi:hypothetical protein
MVLRELQNASQFPEILLGLQKISGLNSISHLEGNFCNPSLQERCAIPDIPITMQRTASSSNTSGRMNTSIKEIQCLWNGTIGIMTLVSPIQAFLAALRDTLYTSSMLLPPSMSRRELILVASMLFQKIET